MGCSASRIPGKLELYYLAPSAPCRSVMLTAHALGIKLDLKVLNVMAGDQLKPEFLKINPAHCIPTLNDEGFALWESRAICAYLVNMYAKDDSLYPKDPRKRAVVDSRLNFDEGTLYQRFLETFIGIMRGTPPTEEAQKKLNDALALFNTLLEGHSWAAGDHVTIADFALVATVSTIEAVGYTMDPYPKVSVWLAKCKETLGGYKVANQDGVDLFKAFYNDLLAKAKQASAEAAHPTSPAPPQAAA